MRFELTDGYPSSVFKTGALNHSATLPDSQPNIQQDAVIWSDNPQSFRLDDVIDREDCPLVPPDMKELDTGSVLILSYLKVDFKLLQLHDYSS